MGLPPSVQGIEASLVERCSGSYRVLPDTFTLQRCAWEQNRVPHWEHECLLRATGSSAAAAFCSRASTNKPTVIRIRR
jgi:hypothetical protein